MNATYFLISTLFDLYLMVVLLRLWLQLVRADFYNPFSQFVVKATHPIVAPLRRVLPSIGSLDTATLVLALAIGMIKVTVLSMMFGTGQVTPVAVVVSGTLVVFKEILSLLFWVFYTRTLKLVQPGP